MNQLELVKSKIIKGERLRSLLNVWRFKDYKIVFTNGCFDILHYGHIVYLAKASELGNILIIGLNTDVSVSSIKGNSRPVQYEKTRAYCLAALHFVDAVVLFDDDTPYNLISSIRPDILVKGSDYKPEDIAGYDIVKSYGGRIINIELSKGYSTTGLINKIKKVS